MEEWRPIEGFEGIYEVSNLGRVRNIKKGGRLMTPLKVAHGYLQISLSKKGTPRAYLVHRLVAMTFIPNPENKPQVNHIDGDKAHNSVSNLEWATAAENIWHATQMRLKPERPVKITRNPECKPYYTANMWHSNLKDLREKKGLSQEELAEVCCVRLDTIQKLESNGYYFRSMGVTVACKLSWALGVNIEALFEYDVAEAVRKEKEWHHKG